MSANDELRDELTKRGVEWEDMSARFPTGMLWCTSWTSQDGEPCTAIEGADDIPDGKLSVQALLTPTQAIAATLGVGTCHDEGTFHSWGYFTCSNCKVVVPVEAVREAPSIGKVVPISFCPNCGRRVKVVDE